MSVYISVAACFSLRHDALCVSSSVLFPSVALLHSLHCALHSLHCALTPLCTHCTLLYAAALSPRSLTALTTLAALLCRSCPSERYKFSTFFLSLLLLLLLLLLQLLLYCYCYCVTVSAVIDVGRLHFGKSEETSKCLTFAIFKHSQ